MGDQENYDDSGSSRGVFGNKKILVVVALFIICAIILVGFFTVSKKSSFTRKIVYKFVPVFERLEEAEAAKLREELSYENFHFKTKMEGKFTAIEIREDEADSARIKMAQKGLPAGGVVGFEIFDKSSSLGVTDFDKRIKFVRALSGELSRNISRISSIENARVQIVLPEEKIFSFKKPEVTASVLVQRKKGASITVEQIRGIMHLMAASVESLSPGNVTVVDMEGNILSERVQVKSLGKPVINNKNSDITEEDMSAASDYNNIDKATDKADQIIVKPLSISETTANSAAPIDYFALKSNLETDLTQKINKILNKLYPIGSTSLIVNIDFADRVIDGVPPIKGKNILILIDTKKAPLTRELKNTTFTSVASVIGYKKKNDKIELRTAVFTTISSAQASDVPIKQEVAAEASDSILTNNVGISETATKSSTLAGFKKLLSGGKKNTVKLESTSVSTEVIAVSGNSYGGMSNRKYSERSAKQKVLIEQQSRFFNIKIFAGIISLIIVLVVISVIVKKRRGGNTFSSEFDTSLFNNNRDVNMMQNLKEDVHDLSDDDQDNPEIARIRNIVEEDPDKIANVLKDWLTEPQD